MSSGNLFTLPDLEAVEDEAEAGASKSRLLQVPKLVTAQTSHNVKNTQIGSAAATQTTQRNPIASATEKSDKHRNNSVSAKQVEPVAGPSVEPGQQKATIEAAPAPAKSKKVAPAPVRSGKAVTSTSRSIGNAILVSPRQRGNPILKFIKNVPWKFQKTVPDFVVGATTCALYLSLRYHLLHPDYLHTRMSELRRSFTLRVVLLHIDLADSTEPLLRVSTLAAANDFTVVLVWSLEEAARYLETYKLFENKSATAIQQKVEEDFDSRAQDCLTAIRSVNRTDVKTLLSEFGSIRGMMNASMEELSLCNGIGDKKVRFIWDTIDVPFFEDTSSGG